MSDAFVPRERLAATDLGRRAVSLVSAPAGSGKTMLVVDWAHRASDRGEAVAWLALDESDDRPYEFWSALIDALIEAAPTDAAEELDQLSPPRGRVEPRFITALTEVLDSSQPVRWLVLDDVHRLRSPDVLVGLDALLADLPPGLGVVLISRYEPDLNLHRLRLSGAIHDVRAEDLAFTESEASDLFERVGSTLSPLDVARVVARTEGWAAGLRLAAVSLAGASDPSLLLAQFEGDRREVADYLFTEVVQHLPDDTLSFLLATCAPEQLSVELAAELSGRADAGRILDRLCRLNALVVQSGDSSWYRYHSLMRDYLSAALARGDVDAPQRQHAAAARWFDHHDEPVVAFEHALRARDPDLLAGLIRSRGVRLILSGHAPTVRDTIAHSAPAVRHDPGVVTIAALAALELSDAAAADEQLAALAGLGPPHDAQQAALRAAAVVNRALLGGDVPRALRATGILERPLSGDADIDLTVLVQRGPARMRTGDYAGATADLERALELARAGGHDQVVLTTLSQLAGITGAACDFPATQSWTGKAIEYAVPRGWADSPRLAYAYLLAGWTAFQVGDERAGEYADKAIRALEEHGNVEVEVGVRSMHALATFEATTGTDRHRAVATFREIWESPHAEQVSPGLIGYATPQEIRLALAVGEHDWADDAVERVNRLLPNSLEALAMRAQLWHARGRSTEARRLLTVALRDDHVVHQEATRVSVNVLAAVVEEGQGNDALAFEALERAVALAAPRNFRRPFIDLWGDMEPLLRKHQGRFAHDDTFVSALLDTARLRGVGEDGAATSNTLSPRELELLRDLPSPLSIRDIAAARGVSINTTKTHLSSVYRKLGVSGRFAAIRAGRDRGLL
ncbi:AAA family ATPase [Occultella gossypii]|uniref:AAA family ATPase n=1 Tax=Occultella gossypii TaxID=2800820 RepID=A0ABS7S696_9MICO|nr:AAA family ATPase [Occultella gossypii]MBZ2195876.1 AAA family ATPase [Occultella gossypii]